MTTLGRKKWWITQGRRLRHVGGPRCGPYQGSKGSPDPDSYPPDRSAPGAEDPQPQVLRRPATPITACRTCETSDLWEFQNLTKLKLIFSWSDLLDVGLMRGNRIYRETALETEYNFYNRCNTWMNYGSLQCLRKHKCNKDKRDYIT